MLKMLASAAAAVLSAMAMNASAAELHGGDIEVSIVGGKLVVEGAPHVEFGTGYAIFEGSLATLLSGPRFRTTDPGFDSEPGTFAQTDKLHFGGFGTLAFWDGDSWESSTPGNEVIVIRDSLDETLTFSASALTPSVGFDGFISDGGPTGQIHQHVSYTLQNQPSGGTPSPGAYRVGLVLSSAGYTTSDPFYVVLNRGLDDAAFEESIHAMAVPEPETYALMGLGLGLIGFVARRRRA